MITLPTNVTQTMKILTDSGFAVYAVGGSVRDALIGLAPKDWDLATNARLWNLESLFPDAKIISDKYSVVRRDFTVLADAAGRQTALGQTENHLDIATFRKEGDYGDSRRPDWVTFVDTVEEDLMRRDFTINAIAYSATGEMVDPFGGLQDLKDHKIRCIGDPMRRFGENPIRMLRAARMAAEFGFWPEDKVLSAMRDLGGTLAKAGPDRIRTDFVRLVESSYPSRGLKLLLDTNLLDPVIGISDHTLSADCREKVLALTQSIDTVPCANGQRLGLFYRCLGMEQGKAAIFALNFDKKTRKQLESFLRQETEGTC